MGEIRVPVPGHRTARNHRPTRQWRSSREASLALVIYLAVILASILYPTSFFSAANLRVVLNNLAVEGILAMGMMMLMIGGVFDLSVGSLMSLVGVVAGWLMVGRGWPVAAAVAAGVLLGDLGDS